MLWLFVALASSAFVLTSDGYFVNQGVNVMAFDDIYPEGHQSGVSVIMHANRIATNGDIRLEHTPGQWQPVPLQGNRTVDNVTNTIKTFLSFPDASRDLTGFNPMIYPDITFNYNVTVTGENESVLVTVDLDRPIPVEFLGKVGFNLELFPGALYGKPWIMDDKGGIFPRQPNGPTKSVKSNADHRGNFNKEGKADPDRLEGYRKRFSPIVADDIIAEPYCTGKKFTVRPDSDEGRITFESLTANIELYDGRMNHNNGWFVLHSDVPEGATVGAVKWRITPNVLDGWLYKPVVEVSQVGYHPKQEKISIIELDRNDNSPILNATLFRITIEGNESVYTEVPQLGMGTSSGTGT